MSKRVLLCLSHSIEEHDQLRLLDGLGYEVASIGGYINPREPHDPKRPALDIPQADAVREAVDALGTDDNLGAAQRRIPEGVLEWLGNDGIIIFHHYLSRLFGQWDHLQDWRDGGGRVIWRTVGQSTEANEREARPFRNAGLEIVRYSPNEAHIPGYAGADALIRFYKDEHEWSGWTGPEQGASRCVVNVTQNMLDRAVWCNYGFWQDATRHLPVLPLGPGSEKIGGAGEIPFEEMKRHLRHSGAYLYTGTQPASYTLGLIEALLTGIPTVSIGPSHMQMFPYGPDLFEGHTLTGLWSDAPADAYDMLLALLRDRDLAQQVSRYQRARAVETFGMQAVGAAWVKYLG